MPWKDGARFVRLGSFVFDTSTGELVHDDDSSRPSLRLSPQPALLLKLLIEKRGALLTRDEIRERIWPEGHVEFDQSLHFCVRQIRAALGDRSRDAQFIETLPRRGYRLLVEPEAADVASAGAVVAATGSSSGHRRSGLGRSGRRWIVVGMVLAMMVAVSWWSWGGRGDRTRLAIMPFVHPDPSRDTAGIADRLLYLLGNDEALAVIGPTSTARMETGSVVDTGVALGVSYVINGRFLEEGGADCVLVELIRVSDGVHVWVRRYCALGEAVAIGDDVAAAVRGALVPN